MAARIAAGEVVERPASVVKELIENSLDAGARRITVEVAGGGLELIRVADDGQGIGSADLELAFERHATSKISSDDDLERIETLGFRGEALASIAAVADVDCTTRSASESHAWTVRGRGGRVENGEPSARTVGTTVTVRELFGALPARRKFLRGRSGESGQIANVVSQLALAFPEVAFGLTVDGRRTLETPGGGDLVAAMVAVHGHAVADALAPIADDRDSGDGIVVAGCLASGSATLPTRAGITLLVNRRVVQHRGLGYAVDESYRTLVPVGRHPIAVLDIRIPPAEVDANVHPRKAEVRLLRERAVFGAVQRAVRRTLERIGGPRPLSLSAEAEGPADQQVAAWERELRILGQAGGTYIIAEGAAGLYLVDQHAAHERVLYEALSRARGGHSEIQPLLEPLAIELAPREAAVVRDHLGALGSIGYQVEPFGERTLLVRAVPGPLAERDPIGTLLAALGELADEAPPADWRERLVILFACHNAVRAGDALSVDEMIGLLRQLGETDLCQACSHGRPTAILLSHGQLAKEFGRT